jgi:hypothetical protein
MLTTRIAALTVLLGVISISNGLQAAVSAGPAPRGGVEALLMNSRAKRQMKQAQKYQDQFLKAIQPTFVAAMKTCTNKTPDTVEPGSIAFVIGADGRVKRLLWSGNIALAQCVGEKLRSITTLPKPPEDN